MSNKVLLKDDVVTRGSGRYRAVLDHAAGLVYAYAEPGHVIAVYEDRLRAWLMPSRPYYSSGGWGKHSHGDSQGAKRHDNAAQLLSAVNASVLLSNHPVLLSFREWREYNKVVKHNNALAKRQASVLKRIGKQDEANQVNLLPALTYKSEHRGEKRGTDPCKEARGIEATVKLFTEQRGKGCKVVSGYTISANLVVQNSGNSSVRVAFRDASGNVYLNSQQLSLTRFEEHFLGGQSLVQAELRKVAKYSIPFNVLESASLELSETEVAEQGPDCTVTLKSGKDRHFTGALLLRNKGRTFLMDLDRGEVTHGLFNVFFVEVDSEARTIAEAYDSMVPQEVKEAIEAKREVKRQGEWFLVKTEHTVTVPADKVNRWGPSTDDAKQVAAHRVAHGKGRPNTVFKPVGFGELDQYVCGTMEHTGREHAPLDLGRKQVKLDAPMGTVSGTVEGFEFILWKLVGNTTVSNFTITGEVD